MVRKITPLQTLLFAGLTIMLVGGTASASEQVAPQQQAQAQTQAVQPLTPAPATITRSSMVPMNSSAHVASDDCKRGWSNCWLVRACQIHHHDKCMWHSYIRGNGPAIHTRPAGIYWW